MKYFSPIIQTIITEKSSAKQADGTYTFLVRKDANKIEIKNAIRDLYGAEVKKIRTMLVSKKTRLVKGIYKWAKRPAYKKALVTLKAKTTIDPNKIGAEKKEKKKTAKPKKTKKTT